MVDYWPYVVIIVAGWLATDMWRWLGVIAGNRLREGSEALNWVRAVATALVMAVTAKLVVFPSGWQPRVSALQLSCFLANASSSGSWCRSQSSGLACSGSERADDHRRV